MLIRLGICVSDLQILEAKLPTAVRYPDPCIQGRHRAAKRQGWRTGLQAPLPLNLKRESGSALQFLVKRVIDWTAAKIAHTQPEDRVLPRQEKMGRSHLGSGPRTWLLAAGEGTGS
jgi:hypothetical protein